MASAGEAADAIRVGHEGDLEIACDEGAVAENASRDALFHLHGPHPLETHGGGAPLRDSVHDQELLAGEDELGTIPAPDGGEPEESAGGQEQRADEPEGSWPGEYEESARECKREGAREGARKRGGMRPLVEADVFSRLQITAHAEEFFASAGKSSFFKALLRRQSRHEGHCA
jgi:hypothetical protein